MTLHWQSVRNPIEFLPLSSPQGTKHQKHPKNEVNKEHPVPGTAGNVPKPRDHRPPPSTSLQSPGKLPTCAVRRSYPVGRLGTCSKRSWRTIKRYKRPTMAVARRQRRSDHVVDPSPSILRSPAHPAVLHSLFFSARHAAGGKVEKDARLPVARGVGGNINYSGASALEFSGNSRSKSSPGATLELGPRRANNARRSAAFAFAYELGEAPGGDLRSPPPQRLAAAAEHGHPCLPSSFLSQPAWGDESGCSPPPSAGG